MAWKSESPSLLETRIKLRSLQHKDVLLLSGNTTFHSVWKSNISRTKENLNETFWMMFQTLCFSASVLF